MVDAAHTSTVHPGWRTTRYAAEAVVLCLLLSVNPGLAHSLKVFAAFDGRRICGSAYVPGGRRLAGATVEIHDGTGQKLGETVTDARGAFAFEPVRLCDHRFVVDTGDGHRADCLVSVAELNGALSATAQTAGSAAAARPGSDAGRRPRQDANSAPASGHGSAPFAPDGIRETVQAAIRAELKPLREQIDRYEARVRLHDILGGIGYILGVAGILFFATGRQRKAREAPDSDS